MRVVDGNVQDTLRRAQGFMDKNGVVLGPINQSGARTELDDLVAELSGHAVAQDAGDLEARGGTSRHASLREELRNTFMRPVALIARAKLRTVPDFSAFRLPGKNMATGQLVAAAGAMADAARAYVPVFVKSGLTADFADKLVAAAQAVTASTDGRAEQRGRRVGATAGLKSAASRARHAIKILDSLIVPVLGTDDVLLAEWKSLKKFRPGPAPRPTADKPEGDGTSGTPPSAAPAA